MWMNSETVYCSKKAMMYKQMGFAGVSYDTKLSEGEWYYQDSPHLINLPISDKGLSKFRRVR